MASQPQTCTNEDCSFATDGKCVEGLPLEECPHLTTISVGDIAAVDEPEAVRIERNVISLDLGEALTKTKASSLQTARASIAVGIIGPNDAGKTSLLASVYDLFQEGPVGDISFAGCASLVGFEKVCHDARVVSRRGTPHTDRTTQGEDATFFHLDLRPAGGELVSLFIGDRSGEDYLAASDDLSAATAFFELRRADVIAVLVNGEHLASSEFRHEAKAASPQIIDALVESSTLRKGCRLAIVLTKQDAVLTSEHANRVQRDFGEIVDGIAASHGSYLGEIEPFVVAASPKDTDTVKRGDGVDDLLRFWIKTKPGPEKVERPVSGSERMIDLLDAQQDKK